MAIIKCKMCGGDLTVAEGASIAECEYCGTMQTVPNQDNEKKLTLFSRANRLRLACEFDKASGVYENIVSEFPEESEAYWGLVLCCYGIEYVDDPTTGKKVPTCHRSSFHSVLENSDFEQAYENADAVARRVYRDEAKTIEEIRKGILEVSGKEPPYDIFICYKETDENGDRTIDSVLAQDVYDALIAKGYRVFFARITLEDKLGTEYEPYIFAALNSAKVMLVFGTDYEYFNAVWVKNEWSRFLKLMAQDKSKHLIPCYKDVDAYDMPKEFQKLQAQDLSKVGAVQDLLRGIDKLLNHGKADKETVSAPAVAAGSPTAASLLERGQLFLEDENWDEAGRYFDKVLDLNPRCAEAYLGKVCAENEYMDIAQMAEDGDLYLESLDLKKAVRFAEPALQAKLKGWMDAAAQLAEEQQRQEAEQRRQAYKTIRSLTQNFLVAARHMTIGLRTDGAVVATGNNQDGQCNVSDWRDIVAVCAGGSHTVGLRADGTVVATGYNYDRRCNVSDWRDIVAVCAGGFHTVGLQADGTVVAVGDNQDGQCNVSDWRDIVAVAAGNFHTIGLKFDGTVVAVGDNEYGQCGVSYWRDIVAICTADHHAVGLRADGTVVAVGYNRDGRCNVSDWRNIVAVCAGGVHTVGLRADGTVVATGYNDDGQCNVSDWRDIVDFCAAENHTVGLRADGTVVAAGDNINGQCNVSDWRDIVAVCAGYFHTVGLRADGTVVAMGNNHNNQCYTSRWRLFIDVEDLDLWQTDVRQRREEAEQRRKGEEERRRQKEARRQEEERVRQEEEQRRREEERARRKAQLEQDRTQLQTELANLKGLFTGKRRKEIEARLAEIKTKQKNVLLHGYAEEES